MRSPHIWRQVDTLGTSVRYLNRWLYEGGPGWQSLLPAALDSGDHSGIMAMECPLLNLALVPGVALGRAVTGSSYGAAVAANLLMVVYLAGLLGANLYVWRGLKIGNARATDVVLAAPLLSFLTPFFGKIIPDISAALLVFFAVGCLWGPRQRWAWALVAACAGVLMKPPAIVGMALLLARPRWRQQLLPIVAVGVSAFALALAYYLYANPLIAAIGGNGSKFQVEARSPWEAFRQVFGDGLALGDFINYHLLFPFGAATLVLVILVQKRASWRRLPWVLVACLAMQLVAVGVLDGGHMFMHAYYCAPLAFTVAAWILSVGHWLTEEWTAPLSPRRRLATLGLAATLAVLWISRVGEIVYMDVHKFFDDDSYVKLFAECHDLQAATPDWPWQHGQVFRSSDTLYPLLGLCFGERVGSDASPYGFFAVDKPLPATCSSVRATEHVQLARCL